MSITKTNEYYVNYLS